VLVRLVKIAGVDLNVFDFDYDLTWAGFFLGADEKVYGRFGGRDASGPDRRLSLAGLRHAMRAALDTHRREAKAPAPRLGKPRRAENYPAARSMASNECIHCHQVHEFRRAERKAAGTWKREEVWLYPLPENVGLTLDVDRGDSVRAVQPGTPAAKLGVRAGDVIRAINSLSVASQADFRQGLHRAPWEGKTTLSWQRDGKTFTGQLELKAGWKKTNNTWRPSLLDILPALTVYGDDLDAAEKKKLGLPASRLAFRQDAKVHSQARAAGVRAGDIILGIEGETLDTTVDGFLAHVRRHYLVGDRISLRVLRDGKRVSLPMTLK
jgi:predicted metalloprotease with PDZ domain